MSKTLIKSLNFSTNSRETLLQMVLVMDEDDYGRSQTEYIVERIDKVGEQSIKKVLTPQYIIHDQYMATHYWNNAVSDLTSNGFDREGPNVRIDDDHSREYVSCLLLVQKLVKEGVDRVFSSGEVDKKCKGKMKKIRDAVDTYLGK